MALTEFTNKLLKEAIADAEAVRQTAIENAKLSLEETFTPQIKSMLSRRLRAEAEGTESEEEEKDVETQEAPEAEEKEAPKAAPTAPKMETAKEVPHEEAEGESKSGEVPMDTSAIASSDNAEPSDDASDSSEIGTGPEAETDNSVDWYDDWSESDFDLDEVIKELEADLNDLNADDTDEAYPAEEPEAGAKKPEIPAQSSSIGKDESHIEPSVPSMEDGDEAEEAPEAPMAPDAEAGSEEGEEGEEELDLEVILKELEADEMQKTADSEKMASLEKELAEYRQAVQLLRGKLNEVNLLNAKLLYTNKILHKEGLNDEQKVMVVENFDRATSVREVKMVYAVLVETLTSVAKVAKATKSTTKVVAEGLASKATPSTAPKAAPTEVIAENSVAKRLQQLAGLI